MIWYLHSSALDVCNDSRSFVRFAKGLVEDNLRVLYPCPDHYDIAFITWMYGRPITNVFRHIVPAEWPGTPKICSFAFDEAIYRDSIPLIGTTENIQVLHLENEYGRQTGSLEEYLASRPNLGKINPFNDLGIVDGPRS